MRTLLILALFTTACSKSEPPPEPCPVCPEAKKELNAREVLELAADCARRPPYDGKGVGGNALRFDGTATLTGMIGAQAKHIYRVRLYEERVTSVPNGLALSVDGLRKTCSPVPMD